MTDIELITNKYDAKDYAIDYQKGAPIPWLSFDDFLPADLLKSVQDEIKTIPNHVFSKFTRNNSFMLECNNFKYAPRTRELALNFNSGEFITWLETITGLKKIIPDPHFIGAGLTKCYAGLSLQLHTDFNWNEQLNLNRCLSLILYLSDTWDPAWQGNLEFWNFDRTECLHRVEPLPNRLLLWNYDNKFIHGHPNKLTCPEDACRIGLRLFYFSSNSTPTVAPHRSLYWFDETTKQHYDQRDNQ